MSNFGKAMLEKFGWKEGKGLGKEESGISKPIKVNGNFNAYGLGHDVGQEFTNQWWDHLYNKTAGNITVNTTEDGSVKFTRTGDLQVSQKVIPYANAESSQYSRFVKAGVVNEPQEDKVLEGEALSYDEIFKITGGRTAHKGARHGLTMAAKLARVEKQERELLDKWKGSKNKRIKDCSPIEPVDVDRNIEGIKKKRKKSSNSEDNEHNGSVNKHFESTESENLHKHKKKKKTKVNTEMEELSCIEKEQGDSVLTEFAEDEQIENIDSAKKKLKKKHRKPDFYEKEKAETKVIKDEIKEQKERQTKSKRKSNEANENNVSENVLASKHYKVNEDLKPDVQIDLVHKKKKKKKKKHCDI